MPTRWILVVFWNFWNLNDLEFFFKSTSFFFYLEFALTNWMGRPLIYLKIIISYLFGKIFYKCKITVGVDELTGFIKHVSFDWFSALNTRLWRAKVSLLMAVLFIMDTIVILMDMRCMYWTAMPRNIENESKKRHDFKNEGSILKEI